MSTTQMTSHVVTPCINSHELQWFSGHWVRDFVNDISWFGPEAFVAFSLPSICQLYARIFTGFKTCSLPACMSLRCIAS